MAIDRNDIDRQLERLEQLLQQFGAEQKTRLERFFAGMMEANAILAKANAILAERLERAEDLILALDNRLAAVEAMREETDAVRH
jgi:hypothetical protein